MLAGGGGRGWMSRSWRSIIRAPSTSTNVAKPDPFAVGPARLDDGEVRDGHPVIQGGGSTAVDVLRVALGGDHDGSLFAVGVRVRAHAAHDVFERGFVRGQAGRRHRREADQRRNCEGTSHLRRGYEAHTPFPTEDCRLKIGGLSISIVDWTPSPRNILRASRRTHRAIA